jgi:DNA-binding response OmpR family regulator
MKTILIYEPDPDLLEMMCLALEMADFVTIGLHDLNTDLMRLIHHDEPDLILFNFAHGAQSSNNWCQHIKGSYPNLPVLAVSCNYNIGDTYNSNGFDDCISKSFDLEHLYATVDRNTNLTFQAV